MKKIYSPLYVIAATILHIIIPQTLCMDVKKSLAIRMTSAEFSEISSLKSALEYNQFRYLWTLITANRIEACISGLRQMLLDQDAIKKLFFKAATCKQYELCQFFIRHYPTVINESICNKAGLEYRDQYYSSTFDTSTSTNILTKREKH
jgi:hypothetical protein